MKSDKDGSQVFIHVDLNDATYVKLTKAAGGIVTTLGGAKENQDLAGSLDDFLGAIYALILAKHGKFKDRVDSDIEVGIVLRRADQIALGRVRTDGAWMAGFHFNSALFRIDSAYHRILKVVVGVVGQKNEVGPLASKAKKFYRKKRVGWTHDKLDQIHKQTNHLKHTSKGTFDARIATFDDAIAAVEELLKLLEAWRQHGGLAPGVNGQRLKAAS